jgi:MFS family permease
MTAPRVGTRAAQLIVAGLVFVCIGASNAPSPLYVIYQKKWHLDPLVLTAVFAVYAVGVLLALFVAGPISDRSGRRPMLFASAALLMVSVILCALDAGVGWLFAGRFVQGLATGSVTGAAAAAIVELDGRPDSRRASVLTTVAFLTGAACMPLLFGFMAQYGPAPTVAPYLVELALVAITTALLVVVPETRTGTEASVVASAAPRTWIQRPTVPRSIRVPFAIAGASVAMAWSVGSLYSALSGSIESQLLHIQSHATSGVWLFVYNGLGGLAQVGMQRWTNRNSMLLGVLGVTSGMSAVQLSSLLGASWLFYVGTFLAGIGGGAAFMAAMALINEVAPPLHRAAVVSAFSVVSYLAVAIPVVGVGLLAGPVGLQTATGVFCLIVIASALPLAGVVSRLRPSAPITLVAPG